MSDNHKYKEFLLSAYLGTKEKDWIEIKEFKNQFGYKVICYKHPDYENSFITIDDNGELYIFLEDEEEVRPYREASDYAFNIFDGDDSLTELLFPDRNFITISLYPINAQSEIGSMVEDYQPMRYFLEEWQASDVNGSDIWILLTDLGKDSFINKMLEIGFRLESDVQAEINNKYDFSSTEDCKKYLVFVYPETAMKDWKRTSKYKNNDGHDVRRFESSIIGEVFLVDDGDVRICRFGDPEVEKSRKK